MAISLPLGIGRPTIKMSRQSLIQLIRQGLRIVYPLGALIPAVWVLIHPMPVFWLRPVCKDTWAILLVCAAAGALPFLFHRRGGGAWSLSMIALTQAIFQAWCYNTGSHPALNSFQIWGIYFEDRPSRKGHK